MESCEIRRSKRDTPPVDFILKIKSFSYLSQILKQTGDGKYESDEFEASDYKWKLVLYPNGNGKTNGGNHISLYLASTDENAISSGCRVDVLVSFFVYDHIRDNYLMIQDVKSKRYNVLRTEHGFNQLLSLAEFNDPNNGYVFDDCCFFGVEVTVIKNTVKANEFSLIKDPPDGTFTWKIEKFSTFVDERHFSDAFSIGGCKWNLCFYPKGESDEKDHSLSIFLHLDANPRQSRVYVEFNLLVKDQLNGIHCESKKVSHWFGIENLTSWGYGSFMPLTDLHDVSKGFIVNDTLIVEVKITLISASQVILSS